MKQIKKLKLINWHFFENEEIKFSNINVITGENGTGKSTILDAIHYLQSGGSCKFNTAANLLSSGRSVENYLRSRTGVEGNEYSRSDKNIIGHIAMEYFDTNSNSPYTLGVVMALVDNQLVSVNYYDIKNSSWNENLFFNEKGEVRNFEDLVTEGEKQGLEITRLTQPNQSEKKRARAVREALGVNDKYEMLFSKAISFEPLNDISSFAIDFLLPDMKIDLDPIKDAMNDYRELESILSKEIEKKDILEPIYTNIAAFEDAKNRREILDLLQIKLKINKANDSLKLHEKKINEIQNEINTYESNILTHSKAKQDYEFSALQIENDNSYQVLKAQKENLNTLKTQIERIKDGIASWERLVEEEDKIAKKTKVQFKVPNAFSRKNYSDYQNNLIAYKDNIFALKEQNEKERNEQYNQLKEINKSIGELNTDIKQLNEWSYNFPVYVKTLQDKIKQAVINKTGAKDVDTVVFCSTLTIKDEQWRETVERFLGARRFDLFIKNEYKKIAKEVFDSDLELKKCFGVGVVDQLENSIIVNPDSLASKVVATRVDKQGNVKVLEEPTKYLVTILNNIMCVNSSDEFVPGKKAITKEGLYYDGNSIRYLSANKDYIPYIGMKSIEIRLDEAKKELENLIEKRNQIDEKLSKLKEVSFALYESKYKELISHPNLWLELQQASDSKKIIEDNVAELSKNNEDLLSKNNQINDYKDKANKERIKINELETLKTEANKKIGEHENEIRNQRDIIGRNNIDYNAKLEEAKQNGVDIEAKVKEAENEAKGEKSSDWCIEAIKANEFNIKYLTKLISDTMLKYCAKYPDELKCEINNYLEYVQRYNKIVNEDLSKLQPEVEKAKETSIQEMNEHFISKIRSSISDAQSEIVNLNKTLKKHPFGVDSEIFQFIFKKSEDPLIAEILRIAVDTNQDTIENNILTENLDNKSKQAMDEVFTILATNDDDETYKKIRKQLLDYRTYYNYDIKIMLKDEQILFYSKNQDSKSGGETQTPFYAMIAAAFKSVINEAEMQRRSPTSLVVFDEAFNNMDGERIRQMLEFYRDLGIQLIISIPSSRYSYVAQYADNSISLAKQNNQVAVYSACRNVNKK